MSAPRPSIIYDARRRAPAHGVHTPVRAILHSTESYNRPGISDITGVFGFWDRQDRGFWAHAVVDDQGNSGFGANGNQIVWATFGANTGSLQIEMVAFAARSQADWMRRKPQLHAVARWLAIWHEQYGIPLTHSTSRGVALHRDFPAGGHTDPGAAFPLGYVLKRARALAAM